MAASAAYVLRAREVLHTGLHLIRTNRGWMIWKDDEHYATGGSRGAAVKAAMVPGALDKARPKIFWDMDQQDRRMFPVEGVTR